MDGEDWIEKFIVCVESRPALYDKRKKEYSDRNLKEKLWTEICIIMVPNWSEMAPQEKANKGKEIQRRWQNLRTCFKRELRSQKTTKSGQGPIKRKKYIYFDQLLFLLQTLEDRETVSDVEPVEREENNEEEEEDEGNEINMERPIVNPRKKKTVPYEELLLNILRDKKNEEIDEEKTFLLSLVPAFKKFNEDQKLEAKTEILRIIRRVQVSPTFNSSQAALFSTNTLQPKHMQNTPPPPHTHYIQPQSTPSTSNSYLFNPSGSNFHPNFHPNSNLQGTSQFPLPLPTYPQTSSTPGIASEHSNSESSPQSELLDLK